MGSTGIDQGQLADLLAAIESRVDPALLDWPGGWPGQIEAALLDAVYSIRARYGDTVEVGVRAVVNRWRRHRGGTADDLSVLAASDPEVVAEIVDSRARVNGRLKAAVVVDAAARLSAAGLVHAADFTGDDAQKRAYLSAKGCGPVTWVYLGMLLGKPGVKADTWIVRFVTDAVGAQVSTSSAEQMVTAAADRLGVTASQLDHAIWRTARTNG